MADDVVSAKMRGMDELRETLFALTPKLRVKAILPALRSGAKPILRAIRARTPVLRTSTYSGASAIRRGVRKPGTVRDAIKVRTSKRDAQSGNVGVFINVVPAKGAVYRSSTIKVLGFKSRVKGKVKVRESQRGAKSPNDPFYWRWVNFGNKHKPGAHMLETGAAQAFPEAVDAISSAAGPAIQKFNVPGARA